jgi:LCP family protein required for cell wall assembly
MKFKTRKIRNKKSKIKNKLLRSVVEKFGITLSFIIIGLVVLSGIFYVSAKVLNSDFFHKNVREIFSFGPLQKDKFGHTNILLLGVAGTGSEGGNLSDSILIVSINPSNPSVSFLSLPRDLFIESKIGDRKVNEIYAAAHYKNRKSFDEGKREGMNVIKNAISNFTGIDIHYGAVIDFKIFENFVDALGGIDIFVLKPIEDPFYPDKDYGYQTFVIRKGYQKLDGATALKYARSRKTSSDYSRAQRQQDIILAIRKKAAQLNLLTDFDKLKSFYTIFKENINTDLGLTEMVALAKIATSIDYNNVVSAVLNDDPTQKGGLLYTPAKEFFGGQFVLLPEEINDTQTFMDLVLIHPDVGLENAQISILNGSKIPGRAGALGTRLRRLGFHVIDVGNSDSERPIVSTTMTNLSNTKTKTFKFLQKFLGIKNISIQDVNTSNEGKELIDIEIVLGTN